MANPKKLKILVELDSLLDTRIGTVAQIDQGLATDVLKNGYHDRIEDKFGGVSDEQFKLMYGSRDIETLKMSTITLFMPLLRHLCSIIHEESLSRPFHSGPEVDINIYPYHMTNEVADEILAAVMMWVGPLTPVNVIRIEPKDLIPAQCNNYGLMVMYDPTVWINTHLEALIKKPLRNVALYIPQILRNNSLTDEELKKEIEDAMDPFLALDLMLKPFIDLAQLDIKYFSILKPKELLAFDDFKFSSSGFDSQDSQIAS